MYIFPFRNKRLSAAQNQFYDRVAGEATIPSGSNEVTVTFASKVRAKTFYVFTWKMNSTTAKPGENMVRGELLGTTTSTQLKFTTDANVPADINIKYYIFEGTPNNPINVLHGTHTWTGQGQVNITIPAVSLTNTFVIGSHQMTGSTPGEDDPTVLKLPNSTTLQLEKAVAKTGGVTSYQVIENSRWTVGQTPFQITSGTSSATVTIPGGHTYPSNQSFVVASGKINVGYLDGNNMPRCYFGSTTQMTGVRAASPSNVWDITAFAVDTAGDFEIQPAVFNIPASNTTGTATLGTAINQNRRAIISGHVWNTTPHHNSGTSTANAVCDMMDFQNDTTVRSRREGSTGQRQDHNIYCINLK